MTTVPRPAHYTCTSLCCRSHDYSGPRPLYLHQSVLQVQYPAPPTIPAPVCAAGHMTTVAPAHYTCTSLCCRSHDYSGPAHYTCTSLCCRSHDYSSPAHYTCTSLCCRSHDYSSPAHYTCTSLCCRSHDYSGPRPLYLHQSVLQVT